MPEPAAQPLRIRQATAPDAAALARVQRESFRTTYGGILPAEVVERFGAKDERSWRGVLANRADTRATWLAERDGDTLGFASCGPARDPLPGLDGEVYMLYVLQPEQRRGLGRALLRACAMHFVRQGVFGLYLWSLKANRARLFYEALGGEEIAEKHERLGDHTFALVAYGWRELTPLVTPLK